MSLTTMATQNTQSKQQNQFAEQNFYSVGLGISILIFLSTFSYWFIGADNQASLINVFVNKKISENSSSSTPVNQDQLSWFVFYCHLFITGIGLFIFYRSDFSKWLGRTISIQYPIAKLFYENNQFVKWLIMAIKVTFGLLILYTIYGILLEITKGNLVPRFSFTSFIVLFLISTVIWNIKYPKPTEFPDFVGTLDYRDSNMWVRLCDNQIAYVQNTNDKSIWYLVKSKKEVDLSYTEAYLFYERSFSHYLKELIISEDIIGKLRYTFRVEPILQNFPSNISTDQLQILYNRFRNQSDVEKLIFLSIDTNTLLQNARNETFSGLNKYFDTDPNILNNPGDKMKKDFDKVLRNYADFNKISIEISDKIQSKIHELFGLSDMFKFNFEITKVEFNLDEMLKEIIDSRKVQTATILAENLKTQRSILDTVSTLSTTPGVSESRINALLGVAGKLNQAFSNSNLLSEREKPVEVKQIKSPIQIASENVKDALLDVIEKDQSPDVILEVVSKSTPFLYEHKISVPDFLQRLFRKLSNERTERSDEAYRKLIEDTLSEFILS